jgi:hypothetical protein
LASVVIREVCQRKGTIAEAYLNAVDIPLKLHKRGTMWTCTMINTICREIRKPCDVKDEARHGKDKRKMDVNMSKSHERQKGFTSFAACVREFQEDYIPFLLGRTFCCGK